MAELDKDIVAKLADKHLKTWMATENEFAIKALSSLINDVIKHVQEREKGKDEKSDS